MWRAVHQGAIPNSLICAATLVCAGEPTIQRSGIGDDEPEASFTRFSAGVGGGGAGAAADSAALGGWSTGAAGGGCSRVHAARPSTTIAAETGRVSFAMCNPTLQAACQGAST